jgi:hypothetical protein
MASVGFIKKKRANNSHIETVRYLIKYCYILSLIHITNCNYSCLMLGNFFGVQPVINNL